MAATTPNSSLTFSLDYRSCCKLPAMMICTPRLAVLLATLLALQCGLGFENRPIPWPKRRKSSAWRPLLGGLPDIPDMRASQIKSELESYGISTQAFLEKSELVEALQDARDKGLEPKNTTKAAEPSSNSASSPPPTKSPAAPKDTRPREERLKEELERCQTMKAGYLKKELEERGVATKSLLEKSEFVQALAEARVDGVRQKKEASSFKGSEGYAEYEAADVEVLTDDAAGPRPKRNEASSSGARGGGSSSPFGGGGNPFGGGGFGGMGDIADMLKNFGGGSASGGRSPFASGGSPFGGSNPFGGGGSGSGMGDVMGKAQEMMKNPKVQELMAKAQGNPATMRKMQECMSNPAAFSKYQNDPDVAELIRELRKYM